MCRQHKLEQSGLNTADEARKHSRTDLIVTIFIAVRKGCQEGDGNDEVVVDP